MGSSSLFAEDNPSIYFFAQLLDLRVPENTSVGPPEASLMVRRRAIVPPFYNTRTIVDETVAVEDQAEFDFLPVLFYGNSY